jgi:hypothetical protein
MTKSLNGKNCDNTNGGKRQKPVDEIFFHDVCEVTLLRGKHPNFTKETYAVQIKSLLAGNYVDSYLLHELTKNDGSNNTASEAYSELEVSGYITRNLFNDMINHANSLKLNGEFTQVDNLISYLGDICDSTESMDNLKVFEEYVIANLKDIPYLSEGNFNPKSGHGVVILDREDTVEKYEGLSVGVTKNALMSLYFEGYEESVKTNDNHLNSRLKAIIKGWIAKGICISKTKGRNQEVIYKSSKNIGSSKLYVIHCPKVAEEVAKNDNK